MIPNLLGLTSDLLLVVWLATAAFWAVAGMATAGWLRRSRGLGFALGAALPVVGPVGLVVVAGSRRLARRPSRPPVVRPVRGRPRPVVRLLTSGTAVALAAAVVLVTGMRDTELSAGGGHRLLLSPRDLGLTTPVVLTLVVVLASAAVSCWRTSRWAAVAVAWCGSWWLVWSLAALVLGETLEVLARAADLPGPLTAVVTVGTSWSLLLGVAALLLAWSVAVLLVPGGTVAGPVPRPADAASAGPSERPALPAPRAEPAAGSPALQAASPSVADLLAGTGREAQRTERSAP